MSNTSKSLGYRMPAEWEKQEALWISWPHNKETWLRLDEVEKSYVEFVKAISPGQKIKILVNDRNSELRVIEMLKKNGIDIAKIDFYEIKNVDAWIRDYGPTLVVNKNAKEKLAMVKWIFNAWGDKYEDLRQDNSVPYAMNEIMKVPMFEPGIVLEGGSIEVNGAGTVLTTEQCLLNKNRNPELGKKEIEQCLKDYLNVSNVLWLKEGIAGDDTDGHVDDIARFVNKNTVVFCVEDNPEDDNYEILKENYEMLLDMKDQDGKKLNVVKLPMPGIVADKQGRLPASYANFYIGNKSVAVPIFGQKNDKKALQILQGLFPNRKVVGINCRAMVYGLGTLHCCSQQEPSIE